MTMTFSNKASFASVAFRLFVLLLLPVLELRMNIHCAPSEPKPIYQLSLEKKGDMSPPTLQGVEWILKNWKGVLPHIRLEINKQALLRHFDLGEEIGELSLLIDKSGQEWSGFWAVTLTGKTLGFEVPYCYYIELHRSEIVLSEVSGVGYNVGISPTRVIQNNLADITMKNFDNTEFTKHEKMLLAGIWVSTKISNNNNFNECFGFEYKWKEGELNESVYLEIDDTLSCKVVIPFTGVRPASWSGSIHSLISKDMRRFLVMTKNSSEISELPLSKARCVTLVSDGTLLVFYDKETYLFRRPRKLPLFDYSTTDKIYNERVGVLFRK